jgi:hypothetical protein
MDFNSLPPGLAGFLAMQGHIDRRNQGTAQLGLGMLAADARRQEMAQREQESAQAAQLQPLRIEMMQAQADDLRRKQASAKALDDAISQLPPEQQAAARMNPQAFASQFLKEPKETVIPAGGVLARNGQIIASNPRVEAKTELAKLMGDLENTTDPRMRAILQNRINKLTTHAPASTTNVVMTQEKEEAKAVGKAAGESFNEIQKSASEANTKISRYDRIGQLLEGVNTGKLTPTATQISALADSVGIKIDPKLGEKQAAAALSNEIALTLRNPSGGAGMPGALSDRDREFLVSMTPNLSNIPEGNKLLIDTAKKLAKRDQDVARMARDYRQRNGSFGPGFYEELQRYSDANPLFAGAATARPAAQKQIKRTGTLNGRKVVEYTDGTVDYQ